MDEDALARVHRLASAARAALSFERTKIAGRDAIRIRTEEGVSTSFVSPAESEALNAALDSGPPRLTDPRFPACEWNAQSQCFEGIAPGGVALLIMDLSLQPSDESLAHVAAMYAVASAALPQLPAALATRFEKDAKGAWNVGRPITRKQLAAKFAVSSIHLSGDPAGAPTLFVTDGDVFGGHSIEVFLDAEGKIENAQLAG